MQFDYSSIVDMLQIAFSICLSDWLFHTPFGLFSLQKNKEKEEIRLLKQIGFLSPVLSLGE